MEEAIDWKLMVRWYESGKVCDRIRQIQGVEWWGRSKENVLPICEPPNGSDAPTGRDRSVVDGGRIWTHEEVCGVEDHVKSNTSCAIDAPLSAHPERIRYPQLDGSIFGATISWSDWARRNRRSGDTWNTRGTRLASVSEQNHRIFFDRSIDRPVEARVRHPSRSYAGLFPMPVSNAVKGQYTNGSWTITVEDEVGPSAPRCHCLMPIRALGANEDALERMAEWDRSTKAKYVAFEITYAKRMSSYERAILINGQSGTLFKYPMK